MRIHLSIMPLAQEELVFSRTKVVELHLFFWLTSTLLHRYKFGNCIPGCTARAPPQGMFCSSSGPLHIFHWNHHAHGEGPRPRSQGRFGIAGFRTRTGSDVCSVVTNCATLAPHSHDTLLQVGGGGSTPKPGPLRDRRDSNPDW